MTWIKSKGLFKPLKDLKSLSLCFRYCSSQHYTRRIIQKVWQWRFLIIRRKIFFYYANLIINGNQLNVVIDGHSALYHPPVTKTKLHDITIRSKQSFCAMVNVSINDTINDWQCMAYKESILDDKTLTIQQMVPIALLLFLNKKGRKILNIFGIRKKKSIQEPRCNLIGFPPQLLTTYDQRGPDPSVGQNICEG